MTHINKISYNTVHILVSSFYYISVFFFFFLQKTFFSSSKNHNLYVFGGKLSVTVCELWVLCVKHLKYSLTSLKLSKAEMMMSCPPLTRHTAASSSSTRALVLHEQVMKSPLVPGFSLPGNKYNFRSRVYKNKFAHADGDTPTLVKNQTFGHKVCYTSLSLTWGSCC